MKVRGKSRINGPWSGFVQAPVESWGVKRSLRKSQWETRHRLAMKIVWGGVGFTRVWLVLMEGLKHRKGEGSFKLLFLESLWP